MTELVILPVAHKVVDVFWGKGWTQWARFEIKYFNGKIHLGLIKGVSMPKEVFSQLYSSLSTKKHETK